MHAMAHGKRCSCHVDRRIKRHAMGMRPAYAVRLRHELLHVIESAEQSLDEDPDRAALLLDGMVFQIAQAWYAQNNVAVPPAGALLDDLARIAPRHAWRLRLALRAPHAHARAVHLRDLVDAMLGGDEGSTALSDARDDAPDYCLRSGMTAASDALPIA